MKAGYVSFTPVFFFWRRFLLSLFLPFSLINHKVKYLSLAKYLGTLVRRLPPSITCPCAPNILSSHDPDYFGTQESVRIQFRKSQAAVLRVSSLFRAILPKDNKVPSYTHSWLLFARPRSFTAWPPKSPLPWAAW